MVQVIADFGSRGQAVVDDEDYAALKNYSWRREVMGRVVRSLPWSPQDPRARLNRSLAFDVALRMGLDAEGRVIRYRDGNQLNCTRGNLCTGYRQSARHVPKSVTWSQPEGVHRSRTDRPHPDESSRPPQGYKITFHDSPCENTGEHYTCKLRGDWIGMAWRITRVTQPFKGRPGGRPGPDGWEFHTPSGARFTDSNYFLGVAELLKRYQAAHPFGAAA